MRKLDVHGPVYREGPAIQGGINLEHKIEERPPDLQPIRPVLAGSQPCKSCDGLGRTMDGLYGTRCCPACRGTGRIHIRQG